MKLIAQIRFHMHDTYAEQEQFNAKNRLVRFDFYSIELIRTSLHLMTCLGIHFLLNNIRLQMSIQLSV